MKKILAICALGLALIATSCKDYFTLERPNQYPWQSVSELEMAARAPYLYYVGAAWANPIGALFNRFGESDLAHFTGMTGDSYYYAYWGRQWETLVLENTKELEGGFEYLYYMSTACNAPLALLDTEEDPFPNMTASDRALVKRIKGELLFMRAFTYWNLARTWAPPYNSADLKKGYFVMYTKFENDSDKLKNATLTPIGEVYNQIVKDLKDAIELLPEEYYSGDNNNRMRVNKYAAKALLARVYFYMGEMSQALPLLDDVIAQTDLYELDEDVLAPFCRYSGQGTSKEVIFEICYSSNSDRYDRNPGIMGYAAYNGYGPDPNVQPQQKAKMCGYCAFSMSDYAMRKVGWVKPDSRDITDEAKKDKRFNNLYVFYRHSDPLQDGNKNYADSSVFLYKYFRNVTPGKDNRRANRPIIRLADLYLMRAQINFMSGSAGKTSALNDVNAVRKRAGLDNLDSVTEEDIENERIKEMAGENADRIYWLISLKKDIPIGDRDPQLFSPIKYPYEKYYYQVPVLEQRTNAAYQTNN